MERTRWVVKIGSAMLTDNGKGLDEARLHHWCEQMATLMERGIDIIVVSSGAVAEGMKQLGLTERPRLLNQLQAAAAIGQTGLVDAWKHGFKPYNIAVGQILLTHDDAADRKRYLNIKATLETLVQYGAIPVINENDTTSYDEFCFGDNDTLGALVANLIEADQYIILTDQKGIYNSDPRHNPDAKLIESADAMDQSLLGVASSEGGALGTGGMFTKVKAAQMAAKSGTVTYIAKGDTPNILLDIYEGKGVATKLNPAKNRITAKKRWMIGQTHVEGVLTIDDGAEKALIADKKSLLPIGITDVAGTFERGDIVICQNSRGKELGRGLANYNHREVESIMGCNSDEITARLGFTISDEVINRNNWIEKS